MPKPMCVAVHHGLCITAFGTVNPCCSSQPFTKIDEIKNITEHWFSKNTDLQKARDAEWRGDYISECEFCYIKEKKGIMSRKEKMRRWWPEINEEYTKNNPHDIVHMDISFGNSCNQKCIMCSSRFSSKWLEDDKMLVKEASFIRNELDAVEKNWSLSYEKIDEILALITKETKKVEFKGGEPMYDKRFYYFVENAIKINPDILFHVCTNGSFFNKKSIDFINNIPKIHIDISIDGIGDMYNWIRGFDYNTIFENIICFLENCKVDPSINYTTMRYNIDRFEQMYNWIADLSEKYNKKINWYLSQVVTNPKYMSPEYAEKEQIIKAIDQLKYIRNNPRNLKLPIGYNEQVERMITFFETKCIPNSLTNKDEILIQKTDEYMKNIRGYDFGINL